MNIKYVVIASMFTILCTNALAVEFKNTALTLDDIHRMSLEELLHVKIETAGKRVQEMEDVAASVYVITQEDIQESGYMSIAEALTMVPGIHMDRTWYLERIVVRGEAVTDSKLLLMVDGQAMTMKGDNFNIFNGAAPIEMKDIKRMEVILGPKSVLYGSGAFSGVVNIISKNADEGITLSANGSTVGEVGAYLSYGKKIDDMYLSLSSGVQYSEGDDLDFTFINGIPPTNTGITGVADGYNTINSVKASAKLESDSFSIRAQYSDARIVWPDSAFGTDFNNDESYYNIEHRSVQAKHTHRLVDDIDGLLRVYYIDSEGRWHGIYDGLPYRAPDGNEFLEYGGKAYGAEYRVSYIPSDELSIVSGLEFTDNFDTYSVDSDRSYTNGSVFSKIDYRLYDSFIVQAGGRLEKYSFRSTTEFLPELALIYRPVENASLKLAYSRGFLAPSTWELQIADFVGNDDLKPEFVNNYEFIYSHTYEIWSHSLSLYYAEHSDFKEVSDSGFIGTSYAFNSSDDKIFKGIDWHGVIMASKHTTIDLAVSYSDTEERHAITGVKQSVPGSYNFLGYLSVRQVLPDSSVVTVNAKHVSDPNSFEAIDSWNRVDISWLKKDYKDFDIRFKIGNLFDEDIRTYSRGGAVVSIPDNGRFLSVELGTRF